jgi:hypothetical protein
MQDTWCIGPDGGAPLSSVPLEIFDGREPRPAPDHASDGSESDAAGSH